MIPIVNKSPWEVKDLREIIQAVYRVAYKYLLGKRSDTISTLGFPTTPNHIIVTGSRSDQYEASREKQSGSGEVVRIVLPTGDVDILRFARELGASLREPTLNLRTEVRFLRDLDFAIEPLKLRRKKPKRRYSSNYRRRPK